MSSKITHRQRAKKRVPLRIMRQHPRYTARLTVTANTLTDVSFGLEFDPGLVGEGEPHIAAEIVSRMLADFQTNHCTAEQRGIGSDGGAS